jgi:hypothetical protein
MNKSFLRAVAAATLMLALCGCAPEYTLPTSTFPTLPSVPLEQTPLEQLTAAMSAAFAQEAYTVTWGADPEGAEHSQSVTAEAPIDWSAIYGEIPALQLADSFPEAFGSSPLRIIPSNTGIIRYQLSDLSRADALQLLYGGDSEAEFDTCQVAIETLEGLFTRLELQFTAGETVTTCYLTFDYPESQ